jgi:hypothetical protein
LGFAAILALLLLAAGGLTGPWPVAAQAPPAGPPPPRRFLIEAGASEITVLLFKEGLFSGFAHNHVLVGSDLSGEILLTGGQTPHATAKLALPVEAFRVDWPEHRIREGLSEDMSEEDRLEIRAAMLGPGQLHAAKYPRITAVLERVEGEWPAVTAWVLIRIRGGEKRLAIPLLADLSGDLLTAEGEFEVRHSDFAIEPYSSYLGTVAVQDRFQVRFRIQAREIR